MTDEDFAAAQAIKANISAINEEREIWENLRNADVNRPLRLTITIDGRQMIYTPARLLTALRNNAVPAIDADIAALTAEFDAL